MENLKEDYTYYKKCKENKKGNYYKGCSVLEKIFFSILFLIIFYFLIFVLAGFKYKESLSEILMAVMLCIPIFLIEKYLLNKVFYKLELDKSKLIIVENFKKVEVSYNDLKKYEKDEDFIFGIEGHFVAIKIGDKKYFKIKWGEETNVHFLYILFNEKLGIENTEEYLEETLSKRLIFRDEMENYRLRAILQTILYISFIVISVIFAINFEIKFDDFIAEYFWEHYDILINFKENFKIVFSFMIIMTGISVIVLNTFNIFKVCDDFQKMVLKKEKEKIKKLFIYFFIYVVTLFLIANSKYILIMLRG